MTQPKKEERFLRSTFYEQLVEHVFISELLQEAWFGFKDPNARRVALSYRFFGGAPGKPLPTLDDFRVAKHTKANAQGVKSERPNIRLIPKGRFERVETTRELLARLFDLK